MKKKNICIIFIILIALGLFGCVSSDDVNGVVVEVVDDGQFFEVEDKVEENTDYEHEEDILEIDENIDYTEVEEVEKVEDIVEEEEEENLPSPIDIRNIYLAGIPVTRLFEESPIDIFGEPRPVDPNDFFPIGPSPFDLYYEGFHLSLRASTEVDWCEETEEFILEFNPFVLGDAFQVYGDFSSLSINNHIFSTETTREEVQALLGNPVEYFLFDDWMNNAPYEGFIMTYHVPVNDELRHRLEFRFYSANDELFHHSPSARDGYLWFFHHPAREGYLRFIQLE